MVEIVKKKDFVEIEYTGYANGEIFDSNIETDLKKINEKAEARKMIIVVGEEMVVPGLDRILEGKEVGKDYEVEIKAKDGFGERRRELIRILPLRAFTEKKVEPRVGMTLALDNSIVKIIAISGARVSADFNNPLAGKELKYKFKIVKIVNEIQEKARALFEVLFRFVPDFSVEEKKIIVKGPKGFEGFVKIFNERFKELIGKELEFVEEVKKEEKENSKKAIQ